MKIIELLKESELDQLAQQDQQGQATAAAEKPRFGGRINPNPNFARKAFDTTMDTTAGILRGATDAVKNTPGSNAPSLTSFYVPPKTNKSSDAIDLSQTNKQLKKLAKGHVATQSTGDDEIDAILKSAGLMK